MILGWLAVGHAGASLHPSLSVRQLSEGTLYSKDLQRSSDGPSSEESFLLAKSCLPIGLVVVISSVAISRHYELNWWWSAGIGIATWVGFALLLGAVTLISAIVVGSNSKREAQQKAPERQQIGPYRILLCVTREDAAISFRTVLEHWGYRVTEVSNLPNLMLELKRSTFDLLILDLCDSDIELNIHDLMELPYSILVIGCDRHVHGILLPSGFNNFMPKPVEIEAFMNKVREMLGDDCSQAAAQ